VVIRADGVGQRHELLDGGSTGRIGQTRQRKARVFGCKRFQVSGIKSYIRLHVVVARAGIR
jgi:hypothetical protein